MGHHSYAFKLMYNVNLWLVCVSASVF